MAINPEKFLLEEEDGLMALKAKAHTLYKLKAIGMYMRAFNLALKNQNWITDRYYIDLQAGPGKNRIDNQIRLGSPLIALTLEVPFTKYRLNEKNLDANNALQQRVSRSALQNRTEIFAEDVNEVVKTVCDEIATQDALAKVRGQGSTVNLAFLDPFGLELQWSTVKQLAQMKRMDLIINFSTGGLNRNIRQAINARSETKIDRFFGTEVWRDIYDPNADATSKRRAWIDFYLGNLREFGYQIELNPDVGGDEISVKGAKNVQIYSLIFASKHPLGAKLWKGASKSSNPRLPGM